MINRYVLLSCMSAAETWWHSDQRVSPQSLFFIMAAATGSSSSMLLARMQQVCRSAHQKFSHPSGGHWHRKRQRQSCQLHGLWHRKRHWESCQWMPVRSFGWRTGKQTKPYSTCILLVPGPTTDDIVADFTKQTCFTNPRQRCTSPWAWSNRPQQTMNENSL